MCRQIRAKNAADDAANKRASGRENLCVCRKFDDQSETIARERRRQSANDHIRERERGRARKKNRRLCSFVGSSIATRSRNICCSPSRRHRRRRLPVDDDNDFCDDIDEHERRLIQNTREALSLVDKLCADVAERAERRRTADYALPQLTTTVGSATSAAASPAAASAASTAPAAAAPTASRCSSLAEHFAN